MIFRNLKIAFISACLLFTLPSTSHALDPALPAKLRDYFLKAQSKFGDKTEFSVRVQKLDSNNPLFEINPLKPLKPASLTKLLTTVAALRTLGGSYRFPTEIFVDHLPSELVSAEEKDQVRVDFSEPPLEVGNLYIRGYGDPTYNSERLFALAESIYRHGIREIRDLVMDDMLFLDPPRPLSEKPHDAGLGAISVNYNAYSVVVAPSSVSERAVVTITPGLLFRLDNQTRSIRGTNLDLNVVQNPNSASIQALGSDDDLLGVMGRTNVVVKGIVGLRNQPVRYFFSVPDPTAYSGALLRYYLERVGVNVKGKVIRGETPAQAKSLDLLLSAPLASILQELNQSSSNVFAGQVVYALGQDSRGVYRYELGLRRVSAVLDQLNFRQGTYDIFDGSGLDHRNRLTAEQIIAVILEAYKDFSIAPDFIASLSRFGQSGTLKTRVLLKPDLIPELRGEQLLRVQRAANSVWAKTGTLTGVSSLAGVLETMTGERMAFAIMANGEATKDELIEVEDDFVRLLLNLPEKRPAIEPRVERPRS